MPTDLITAPDHPAEVLTHANVTGMVATTAARVLREHEQDKNVTFAALDNDTLASIRQEYAAMQDSTQPVGDRIARDLVGLVRDLLGLDD